MRCAFCPNCAVLLLLLAVLCTLHAAGLKDFVVQTKPGDRSGTHRRTDLSRKCPGGTSRILPAKLDIPLVTIGWRKCSTYFFHPSACCLTRQAACSPSVISLYSGHWPHPATHGNEVLEGIFLPGWHGCHRSRCLTAIAISRMNLPAAYLVAEWSRFGAGSFSSWVSRTRRGWGLWPEWLRHDDFGDRSCMVIAAAPDPVEESARHLSAHNNWVSAATKSI